MNYTNDFWIRIQQYGARSWPTNGRQFDDFRVTTETTPPMVVTSTPASGLLRPPGPFDQVQLTFSEAIDASTLDLSDITLTGYAGDLSSELTGISGSGTNFTVSFNPLGFGHYELSVGPHIRDLAGNPLDQDADGSPGEVTEDQHMVGIDFNDPAQLGFNEDFSSGLPRAEWNYHSFGSGTISVVNESHPKNC